MRSFHTDSDVRGYGTEHLYPDTRASFRYPRDFGTRYDFGICA
jgi:hypothetical protein